MLAHDPDLAEEFPVQDAPFVVRGGIARAVTDPPLALGTPTWKDGSVRLEGGVASVHDPRERARFAFRLRTPRFRCYHVSVWIRTTDFTGTPLIQVLAGRKPIQLVKSLGARSAAVDAAPPPLQQSRPRRDRAFFFRVWGAAKGRLEWRGWRIEEAGPVSLLRRPGAPFVVAGRVEGRDFRAGHRSQPRHDAVARAVRRLALAAADPNVIARRDPVARVVVPRGRGVRRPGDLLHLGAARRLAAGGRGAPRPRAVGAARGDDDARRDPHA